MSNLIQEREYTPPYGSLKFRWHPTGEASEPNEVVGMHFLRDAEGYAIRCYQSDGKLWTFPKDLMEFLSVQDPRMFFVDGTDRELEGVMKYLGEEACRKFLAGSSVTVGGVAVSYRGSLATWRPGKGTLRHVWTLKPFYPTYMVPIEDDCYGVQARGERLVKILMSSGMPLSLHSCGSILSSLASLPFCSAPDKVSELAYNCYHGGWIESMKLGSFAQAYDYDLASAYPTEAAKLYSCASDCGSWYESDRYIQEALYGFAYCHVSMDTTIPFSPIMLRMRSLMSPDGLHPIRVTRNPVGAWEGWMTKDEIEFVVKNWLGDVDVLHGIWFVPIKYRQPFLILVSGLNQLREYAKSVGDNLTSYVSKIVPASLQGKFIQSSLVDGVRVVGTAFNPVYAATITARVRLRVAEAALEDYDHVLGIVVDGVLADKPLPLSRRWKLEYSGGCVIANHGDYDIIGRSTAVSLRKLLEDNYNSSHYPLRGARYVTMAEAVEGGIFALAGTSRPEVHTRVRKVGKRSWIKLPHTCGDLLEHQYESFPMLVTQKSISFGDEVTVSLEDTPW